MFHARLKYFIASQNYAVRCERAVARKNSKKLVMDLANTRAASVIQELLNKYTNLNPNQFSTEGVGWDRPADANDPENHAMNRRVEIKVIALEHPE